MPSDGSPWKVSRRKWITTLGAGIAGSIAGCGGDGGDTPAEGATPTPQVKTVVKTKTVEGEVETVVQTKTVEVTEEETPTPTETESPTPSGPPKDNRLDVTGLGSSKLSEANFRVKHPDGKGAVPNYVYAPMFEYYQTAPEGDRFRPYLLRNPTEEGDWMHFDVVEGTTWQDGTEITAEDIAFNYNFNLWSNSGLFLSVNREVETTGDYSLRISRKGIDQKGNTYTTNPSIWWTQVSGATRLNFKPEHWQWALEELKDRTGAIGDTPDAKWDDKFKLMSAIFDPNADNKFSGEIDPGPRNADGVDWPLGSDLWKLKEAGSNFADLTKHDGHWLADETAFGELRIQNTSEQTLQASLANDKVDMAQGPVSAQMLSARDVGDIGDHWHYAQAPNFGGKIWIFSGVQENPVRNRDVRAALMWVFDRQAAGEKLLNHRGIEVPIELPEQGGVRDFWFDEDTLDQFITYRADEDGKQRAERLLRRQGFERNSDGKWESTITKEEWGIEAGDTLPVKVIVQNDNVSSTIGAQAASDLEEFGIDVNYKSLDGGAFWGEAQGKSQLQLLDWGGALDPWRAYGRLGAIVSGNGGTEGWAWGWALNTKIPPFGQPDATPSEDFNMRTWKDTKFTQAGTIGEAREVAKTMCWYQNWHLAEMPVTEQFTQNHVSVDDWKIEGLDPDPARYQLKNQQNLPQLFSNKNPQEHLWRTGALEARRQQN